MKIGEYIGVDGRLYRMAEFNGYTKISINVIAEGETKICHLNQRHPDWRAARKAQNERAEEMMAGRA